MTRNPFAAVRRTVVAAAAVLAMTMVVVGAAPAGAIIGGNPTSPDLYPHFVRLHVFKYDDPSKSALCGGSVVDTGWILTAAHCMDGGKSTISVDVYVHDTYRYSAIELRMHPLWDGDVAHGHDLALLRIPSYATQAGGGIPEATPVQVGSPTDTGAYQSGVIATVLGHGRTSASGSPTDDLYDLHTPLQSDDYMDDVYNKWYWFDYWNEPLMIGAGWTNHTTCAGDSGGPLTVNRSGKTVQVGVVSFTRYEGGDPACDEPAGYAELSGPQMAWVAANLSGVAARWGACAANKGTTPGKWEATYVENGTGAKKDGNFAWSISCVPDNPDTVSQPGPRRPRDETAPTTGTVQEPTPTPRPTYSAETTGTYQEPEPSPTPAPTYSNRTSGTYTNAG